MQTQGWAWIAEDESVNAHKTMSKETATKKKQTSKGK